MHCIIISISLTIHTTMFQITFIWDYVCYYTWPVVHVMYISIVVVVVVCCNALIISLCNWVTDPYNEILHFFFNFNWIKRLWWYFYHVKWYVFVCSCGCIDNIITFYGLIKWVYCIPNSQEKYSFSFKRKNLYNFTVNGKMKLRFEVRIARCSHSSVLIMKWKQLKSKLAFYILHFVNTSLHHHYHYYSRKLLKCNFKI